MDNKHIFIIGSEPRYLINFRGDLISALVRCGHKVTAMAPAPDSADIVKQIRGLGATFRSFPIQGNGLNPVKDLQTFVALCRAFRQLQPDMIFAYTIKPILWGGIAAHFCPQARFIALIEGLGFIFQPGGLKRRVIRFGVKKLYKIAFARANKIVFLNPDNEKDMLEAGLVVSEKIGRINGIGVNLDDFVAEDMQADPPTTFLLIARLLKEKGIREYVRAARIVKERYPGAVFNLLGQVDPSPDRLPLKDIQQWNDAGVVHYLGVTNDVRPYLAACHVFVLPSYHEGLPRTVMEAMATGRPILTTDVSGCRETVLPGENGFLVPARDADALAECMIWFVEHRDQWEQMGKKSRQMAEDRYDVRKINHELMEIMGLGCASKD